MHFEESGLKDKGSHINGGRLVECGILIVMSENRKFLVIGGIKRVMETLVVQTGKLIGGSGRSV